MTDLFPPHCTDFYKTGHIVQYPKGTTMVYANFTCRGDRYGTYLPDFDHRVVAFGLQAVIKRVLIDFWNKNFFERPREEVVARYQARMDGSLGPGSVDAEAFGRLHDLGYLPVLIKALPEGSRVNVRVPMWTIRNTVPEFYWVTNFLETQLSAELWKSVTSATTAYEYRRLLQRFAERTGSDPAFVQWQGHDFSFRGLSGIQDAVASGAAHLLSFSGTDTIAAIDYIEQYYHGTGLIGGSVPAAEHSVMCMGGEDDELATFQRLITEVYPAGIVSIVSDTWDFWQVITDYALRLKADILGRNGKVVFRPDSGDPVKIIAGDPEAPDGSPQQKGAIECLWEIFGGTITSTGHKLLDGHVGLIYGDSITLDRANRILTALANKGFASANVVFGIGSFTYQAVTRDSYGTAIKATYGEINGVGRAIFKNPKTDDGLKKSANGLLRVERTEEGFTLYDQQTWEQEGRGELRPVFMNSKLLVDESFDVIKMRLLGSTIEERLESTT